jgi:hypothetical protein
VPPINREFFVDLAKPARIVEDLLPKSEGILSDIHLFAISRAPTAAATDDTAVNPAATFNFLPATELSLIPFS